MAISCEDKNETLRCITLSGRLDFPGVEEITETFATLVANTGKNLLVDLTAVTMICSMGIRTLIMNAGAFQRRGGQMVLVVDENTMVPRTLRSVGIDKLLPVYTNSTEAKQALLG